MATTLLLARHGAISWSGKYGASDDGLNVLGQAQAQTLARRLARRELSIVYTSPLARARETAEILAAALGLPIKADERLLEWSAGEWAGLTEAEVRAKYPEAYQQAFDDPSFVIPGGESRDELRSRVLWFAEEIAERHAGDEVLVVGHSGALSALLGAMLGLEIGTASGWPFVVDYCSVSTVVHNDSGWVVQSLNETGHLEELSA